MPPVKNIEGVVKLVYAWKSPGGQNCVNIFHIGTDARNPVSLNDFDIIETAMSTEATGSFLHFYQSCVSTDYALQSVTMTDLGVNHTQYEATLTGGGTGAAGALPPQASVCMSWRANQVGWRGGRFRTYLPGTPSAALVQVNESTLVANYRNNIASNGTSMMQAVTGMATSAIYRLGGVSYLSGADGGPVSPPRATPLWFAFQSVSVHGRLDSQRRRLGKESAFP